MPRRFTRRAILAAAAAPALAGCAARGTLTLAPEAVGAGAVEPIYVATVRPRDGGPNAFGPGRARALGFARFEVSVPPARPPGAVTFPAAAPPDAATDFFVADARGFADEAAFVAALDRRLATLPPDRREIFLFTHGFNTNFSEGLYRQAQMRRDFGTPGASVHFAWPSAARVSAYGLDRESAIFARDALARTLDALARSDAERVVVAAHSMGAMVLMEALRGMALAGQTRLFERLQAIVLMAPDLDVDVFRGQIAPLEPYGTPVYVFFSSRDRALRASSLLRGGSERLGSVRDLAAVEGLPITLIDTSDVTDGADALNHFAVATSPTLIAIVRGFNRVGTEVLADAALRPGTAEAGVTVIQGLGEALVAPLVR
jgi:esterase/lipase superfamily enzyme